ncbi:MAG: Vitamin transporter BtuB precursor [Verrucomicrobiota bacterium]
MSCPTSLPRHLRVVALAFGFGVSLSPVLRAQTAPAPAVAAASEPPAQLERLVVTGSNIRRAEMEKVAPMTVLDQTAIDVRSALLPVDLLT